jgi:hypothetical protein
MQERLPFLTVSLVFFILDIEVFSGKGIIGRSFSILIVLFSPMIIENKLVVVFSRKIDDFFLELKSEFGIKSIDLEKSIYNLPTVRLRTITKSVVSIS